MRAQIAKALDWGEAHADFDKAVEGLAPELRGRRVDGLPHSPWEILEHLRIAQHDILDFCVNPNYVEIPTMEEYWPREASPPSDAAWKESVTSLRRDRGELQRLAEDPNVDLFARIPHGSGQTVLRELLLVADHNAYHLGQLVVVRRLLGCWPEEG